jgi:hypothetical protein
MTVGNSSWICLTRLASVQCTLVRQRTLLTTPNVDAIFAQKLTRPHVLMMDQVLVFSLVPVSLSLLVIEFLRR